MEAPLSRVEAILQNILGADNVLVPPQSRVEAILLAILNNTEYIHPGYPSRVEEILLAIKDGGSYDKKALSRVEDILIHKLNDEEYTDYSEDDLSRVEKLLIQWIDLHPEVIKELTTSSFPISILANGLPLLDYTIWGNSLQSGTPTPDSPIEPEFVGERTENLFDPENGYKIPISSGGVTKNIYLGQAPTTRKIKKLVLTGEENFIVPNTDKYRVPIGVSVRAIRENMLLELNSHFIVDSSSESTSDEQNLFTSRLAGQGDEIWFFLPKSFFVNEINVENCKSEFSAFLNAQYVAGIPVTVWYALRTPETGIVNEPLCKIGDYADSVDFSQSGIEIPTLRKGLTTVIDVETEVEPSSMYLKYSEPSDGPAPKTPVLGTKDREINVTPNNEVYVLRR